METPEWKRGKRLDLVVSTIGGSGFLHRIPSAPSQRSCQPEQPETNRPYTMAEQPRILRPRPRRPFEITPASNESSGPPTPADASSADLLSPNTHETESTSTSVSRTGSILNLTSSTLYGIYQPTAFGGLRGEDSPWGTEVNTPAAEHPPEPMQREAEKSATEPRRYALRRTRSRLSHGMFRGVILPQAMSSALLFGFGIVYGVITVHLHDNHWITPVKLENIHYYDSWKYLGSWGLAGVALGNVLPWLDSWRESEEGDQAEAGSEDEQERTPSWVTVARSIGAFVGIAFAMVSQFPFWLALFGGKKKLEQKILTSFFFSPLSVDSPGNLQPKLH